MTAARMQKKDDHENSCPPNDGTGGNAVLSIQSHVARGCVGNRAATFALELRGIRTDIINTVQYSSMYYHTGCRHDADTAAVLLDGLRLSHAKPLAGGRPGMALAPDMVEEAKTNWVGHCDYGVVLTGFMGSVGFLREVKRFVQELKDFDPLRPLWVCDPVLGDNGKIYVAGELLDEYRSIEVLRLTDVITPNHFELQWLVTGDIDGAKPDLSLEEALHMCHLLHEERGVKNVVITSMPCIVNDHGTSRLALVGSQRGNGTFGIAFDRIDAYLGGTGDLTSAIIARELLENGGDLKAACEVAIGTVQGVMRRTLQANKDAHEIDVVGSRAILDSKPRIAAVAPASRLCNN